MSKIIAIWGKHGVGVSTVAANLSVALAMSDKIVALMSTNLQHGDIQIFFNKTIQDDKGTHMALADQTMHPETFLTPVKNISDNLFIMAVPNRSEIIFTDKIPKEKPHDIYQQLSRYADYLILDISDDLSNALSINGLTHADQIFAIYQSNQECFLWHKCMHNLMVRARVDQKIIPVLNLKDMGVMSDQFSSDCDIKFSIAIPEAEEAYIHKDAGEPLYLNANRKNKQFIAAIDEIKRVILEQ